MKRRNRLKNDLLIDLTSILDVVFIVLLVVIGNQQLTVRNYANEQQEALKVQQETQTSKDLYDRQMEILDDFQSIMVSVAVEARFNPDTITQRHLSVLVGNDDIEKFELVGSNVKGTLDQFENHLRAVIEENSDKPVLLSLNSNDEKILYRDEKAITDIFLALSSEYDNVYITKVGEE